jgi:1-acyl-sn-glycerol-3-phosphate acyltransferase
MKFIRILYKIPALIILSIIGMILMGAFSSRDKSLKNKGIPTLKQKQVRKWWLATGIKIVGLNFTVKGDVPSPDQPALWVANHASWLDIPVVGSMGAGFLSKAEVRKWPVIGWLGEKGGTVYIKRGGVNASQRASQEIANKINAGDNILVFPEGTTSTAGDVRRFHARIFAPVMDHNLAVQPIAVQYLNDKGEPHPKILWQDQSFMSNLLGIIGESSINVILTFLPLIPAGEFSERKRIAELCENQIKSIVVKKVSMESKAISSEQ